MKVNVLRFELE